MTVTGLRRKITKERSSTGGGWYSYDSWGTATADDYLTEIDHRDTMLSPCGGDYVAYRRGLKG